MWKKRTFLLYINVSDLYLASSCLLLQVEESSVSGSTHFCPQPLEQQIMWPLHSESDPHSESHDATSPRFTAGHLPFLHRPEDMSGRGGIYCIVCTTTSLIKMLRRFWNLKGYEFYRYITYKHLSIYQFSPPLVSPSLSQASQQASSEGKLLKPGLHPV